MNAHVLFLAALLALVVEVEQHSAPLDRLVRQLNQPFEWTALPVCSNVELTVACVTPTDPGPASP